MDDDIYKNGDRIEVQMEYETPSGGPPLSDGEEVELLTLLPDFSNADHKFALGNSREGGLPTGDPLTSLGPLPPMAGGRYDLTRWDMYNYDPNDLDLFDLALDVDRAIRDGRLDISASGGDYDVVYDIS